jgi:hypothetical protein
MMAWLLSIWITVVPYFDVPCWLLSLTPVRPERIARADVRELCPVGRTPAALRHAPTHCALEALSRSQREIDRTLRDLPRRIDELKRQQRTR